MTTIATERLIIGAGIAGLTAGRYWHDAGKSLLILDKGRGPGGRVASRRLEDGLVASHGTPCFGLEDPELIAAWKESLAQLAFAPAPSTMDPRAYVCSPGSSSLAKALARDLPLRLETSVTRVRFQEGRYFVYDQEHTEYSAAKLLITCPLPQAAALFATDDPTLEARLKATASAVNYTAQWTAIIRWLEAAPALETPYLRLDDNEVIAIVHEQVPGKLWVLHTAQAWTKAHLEASQDFIITQLSSELRRCFPSAGSFQMQAHRWRYARTAAPLPEPYLSWPDRPGLGFAGDFCLSSSVAGAAASGLSWAKANKE